MILYWLLSHSILMSPHMNFKCTWPHESLWTIAALERPITRMPPQVISKVPLSCKSLPASFNWADKWFFSWVNSQMSLQVTFLSKSFPATCNRALERLLSSLLTILKCNTYMSPQVNLKPTRPGISFLTHITNVRFVSWMNELMSL